MAGDIDLNKNRIKNLKEPIDAGDAVNRGVSTQFCFRRISSNCENQSYMYASSVGLVPPLWSNKVITINLDISSKPAVN